MSDFYKILDIDKKASQEDIRKAFRKKAVEHHPDKGGDEKKFHKINEAYNTLNDTDKRRQYDSGGGEESPFNNGGGGGMDPFFNMFFNRQNRQQPRHEKKETEIRTTIHVDLFEGYKGCTKSINIKTKKKCDQCIKSCSQCNGTGQLEKTVSQNLGNARFVHVVNVKCDVCNGLGSKILSNDSNKCSKCNNCREIENDININIELPKYTFHDFISRKKHPVEKDTFIIIRVIIQFQNGFHKSGDNLCFVCKIDLIDTILGKNIEILHPSGEKIVIDYTKRTDIIKPDTVLHIDDKGILPNSDLVVKFEIQYPQTRWCLSEDTIGTFSSLRENLNKIFTKL